MRLLVIISLLIAAPAAIAQAPADSKGKFWPLAGVPYQLWRYTVSMSLPEMPEMPAVPGMPGMTGMGNQPDGAATEIEGAYLRPCSKAEAKM